MAYNLTNSCLTIEHLDQVRNADYSNQSYYLYNNQLRSNKALYEIIIKILLCLVSIFAALIGNLLVLYTMFVLPKLRKAFTPPGLTTTGISLHNLPKRSSMTIQATNLMRQKSLTTQTKQTTNGCSSNLRRQSCVSINQTLIPYIPPTPSHRKTVNLFILNLIICDLMIVFWCSWVSDTKT